MKRLLAASLIAALAVAPAAFAKNPHGTPPGLANKPGGMPPGQYKKLYARGDHLPMTYVTTRYYIEPARYRLPPPPPGYRWVMVEDHAYQVQTTTGLIANVVANLLTR